MPIPADPIINRQALQAAALEPDCHVELLVWHKPSTRMPDACADVLITIHEGTDVRWDRGYWEGEQWVDSDGMPLRDHVVMAWADPRGPA
mgnify:FL=1